MAAAVVMPENLIAAGARFFGFAQAANFSSALARRRKRTLIDGLVVDTIRAISGGFERIKMRR